MLKTVIIVLKSISGIIWRINIDTLYTICVVREQSLKSKQVVSMNNHITIPVFSIRQDIVGSGTI